MKASAAMAHELINHLVGQSEAYAEQIGTRDPLIVRKRQLAGPASCAGPAFSARLMDNGCDPHDLSLFHHGSTRPVLTPQLCGRALPVRSKTDEYRKSAFCCCRHNGTFSYFAPYPGSPMVAFP